MHQVAEIGRLQHFPQFFKVGWKPQIIVLDVRNIPSGSVCEGSMPMRHGPVALGKDEHLDARVAPSLLLGAFYRLGRSSIAQDKKLELRDGLRKHTLNGVWQQDRRPDNREQYCKLRVQGERRRRYGALPNKLTAF